MMYSSYMWFPYVDLRERERKRERERERLADKDGIQYILYYLITYSNQYTSK